MVDHDDWSAHDTRLGRPATYRCSDHIQKMTVRGGTGRVLLVTITPTPVEHQLRTSHMVLRRLRVGSAAPEDAGAFGFGLGLAIVQTRTAGLARAGLVFEV